MSENYTRLKLIFLGLFVLVAAGLWGYNALYVWPSRACEAHGDWWDSHDRVCAVPMPLTVWTKRVPGAAPHQPLRYSPSA